VKTILLGVLLGLVAAFPHLAGQGAAPAGTAAHWVAAQPLLWAFAAGLLARPWIARRLHRSTP
jgi:hypothetical protein